jgi:hypothetical protein
MFLVFWYDVDGSNEAVHTSMIFFAISRHNKVDTRGFFYYLQDYLCKIWFRAVVGEQCKIG